MEFRVFFKHMDSSLALYAYAEKKLGERIAKYVQDPIEALVTFRRGGEENLVSCQVIAGQGFSLTVEHADSESLYSCVDFLSDKLDRRLRRQKEKIRSHKVRRLPDLGLYRSVSQLSAGSAAEVRPETAEASGVDAAEVIRFEQARRRMLEQRLQ
jgi:ribosomal subunit interface protein